MVKRVVFLHTMLGVASAFDGLARELLPADVQAWHVVDEALARLAVAQGGLSPFIYRRVADHARAAEESGAQFFQITCSTISPCADLARTLVGIPVLKVDDPMVERALSLGRRIGVAATAPTALAPVSAAVSARAAALGLTVEVDSVLCEGAYACLLAGDLPSHDRIVRKSLEAMMDRNDVILLAQGSMARVAEAIGTDSPVPILTSPRLAVEHLRGLL